MASRMRAGVAMISDVDVSQVKLIPQLRAMLPELEVQNFLFAFVYHFVQFQAPLVRPVTVADTSWESPIIRCNMHVDVGSGSVQLDAPVGILKVIRCFSHFSPELILSATAELEGFRPKTAAKWLSSVAKPSPWFRSRSRCGLQLVDADLSGLGVWRQRTAARGCVCGQNNHVHSISGRDHSIIFVEQRCSGACF